MEWVWFGLGLVVLASLWWPAREIDRRMKRREDFWKAFDKRYGE